MNKKKKIIICSLLGVILIAGAWLGIDYKMYCKTYFPNNTIINKVDCSGMTVEMAKKALTKTWNDHEFVITTEDEELAELEHIDFTYDIDASLQEIRDNGYKFPLYVLLCKKNADLTIPMVPAELTTSFEEEIAELPIYEQENEVKTENAYVDMSNNAFDIVPEVYGNNIDAELVKSTVLKNISKGVWTLEYKEENFYEQPTVKKDTPELLDEQAYCKKYLAHEITYLFGSNSYTVTPVEMNEMLTADTEGKITIHQDKVAEVVANLAKTYDTVDTDRLFSSTSRGKVMVYGGTYGYAIDQAGEAKQLTADLEGLKDVSREPVYAQEGYGWENNGFGSTYVEVDLSTQNLFYYQNGKQMMACPIVSGMMTKNYGTVTGAFQIVYMDKDVTLKGGSKKKKTYYESHVDYWMPFYGDYGLHDANWRSKFGGKIYYANGSHGCINMPPASAAQLYNYVSPGTPVIVFY